MANSVIALKTILCHEVGNSKNDGLVDNPKDPGGITKYGISFRFLKDHGIDVDGDGDIDADDIRNLNTEETAKLYRQFFWNLVHGDDFTNQEVATKLFDMAVNMGPKRAIHLAQESAGAEADGVFGPKTFRLLNVDGDAVAPLLLSICSTQAGFYRGIVASRPDSKEFLEGWLVRAKCTTSNPCRTCRAFLKNF